MSSLKEFKERIDARMDLLQGYMESNQHLSDKDKVTNLLAECRSYWSFLNDEDKDYLHGVEYAIENSLEWNLDTN